MLNRKTLGKLIVVTMVCAVPVTALIWEKASSGIGKKNAVFLPHLLDKPDNISKVIIQDHENTLTIERGANSWQVVEKGNYPALSDKVQALLFGLADMRVVEQKTANPQLYAQLDLADISEPDSKSIQVTVQDDQAKDLAKIIIGKRESLRLGEEYSEHIFVRNANDNQAWLVQGLLPISESFKDWVEQPLLSLVPVENIKRMSVLKPDGARLVITKHEPEQEDFVLETAEAKHGMVLDIDSINTLPFEVAELEFNDVLAANDPEIDWKQALVVELQTFPGVSVNMHVVKHGDSILGRVHASAPWDASADVQQRVASYNESKQSWLYNVPDEFYRAITISNADLLKVAVEENPTTTPDAVLTE